MALPRLEAYLESLPKGLDSYADHVLKASFYRQFLDDHPLLKSAGFPGELGRLVAQPLPVSSWMSEAHTTAFYMASIDLLGLDDDTFLQAIYRLNVRVLRGPMYRVMMMVISPSLIVRGAESRWNAFHRGIRLSAEMRGEKGGTVRLVYPTNLYSPLMARAYTMAFRAAIEAAGGKSVEFAVTAYSPTVAEFEGRWL
jgi:hypothetical protein